MQSDVSERTQVAPCPDSVIGRARQVWSHLHGVLTVLVLKLRYWRFVQNARPLAIYLENELFPLLREEKQKMLVLHCNRQDGRAYLSGTSGDREFGFPDTDALVEELERAQVAHVSLDTRLEYGQVVEALLILLRVAKEIPKVRPADFQYTGWHRRTVAALMLGPSGYHKVCAKMRYIPGEKRYEVEYSYCELFFTRVVRNYVERRTAWGDHRALLSAAPRAVMVIFFMLILGAAAVIWDAPLGTIVFLLIALAVAGIVGICLYTIGSIQYTSEHYYRLTHEYYNQVKILSRFPETDPNPIIKLDLDGNVLYLNPATRKLLRALGLTEDAVCEILPKDYRELVTHCLEQDPLEHDAEAQAHGRVIHYIFSPFPDEQSVIAAGSDVTYLKRIEQELRDLNQNLEEAVQARTRELQDTQDVTILTAAALAEMRDPDTREHLQRTRLYVKALAEELCDHPRFLDFLDDTTIEQLYKSTPLHDIGKIGVPDAVLLKPGRLTQEEFDEVMKRHTVYGGDALRWAEERLGFDSFLRYAREIAYYHHERWDGRGYPFGLRGEQIPPSARLMALADVYDALTTKRIYKEAFSHEEAKATILQGKSAHFDPAVVDAFLAIEDQFIEIAVAYRDPELVA